MAVGQNRTMPTPPNDRVAEISVRYKNNVPMAQRQVISSSVYAFLALWPTFEEHHESHEAFRILLLDRGNRLKGIYTVSQGGLVGTIADPKLIFSAALRTRSCAIVLAHNHPSGQCRPSAEDLKLTEKLVAGGRLLDIDVNDHIIVAGPDSFYSFADNGLIR